MTAVRSVRSTAYGAKLFAYVLAVAAVGGGLLGLGYSLAWPGLVDVVLGGAPVQDPATLAAGAVLGLLGVYVLGAGLLGALHKLVADGVATGLERADLPVSEATGTVGTAETVEDNGATGDDGTADSEDEPADARQPYSGPQSDSGPQPGSGEFPGTDPEAGDSAAEPPAAEPARAESTGVASSATAATDRADGTTAAAEGDHRSTESGARASPAGEAEPGSATDATGAVGTPAGPDQAAPEPEGTSGLEAGVDATSDPVDADDDGQEWTPAEDLETEPVAVEPTETVPVEEGGDPGPADVGVDDVGPADQPADTPADPPEPSPEEIAFGSTGGDADWQPGQVVDADTDSGAEDAGSASGDGTVTEREDWFEEGIDEESGTAVAEGEGSGVTESGSSGATESEGSGTTEGEGSGTTGVEPAGSTAPSDPLADPNEGE